MFYLYLDIQKGNHMTANFICPVTNEAFHIKSWKAKLNSVTKEIEYFESGSGWKTLTNPKNGVALIRCEVHEIHVPGIKTDTKSR